MRIEMLAKEVLRHFLINKYINIILVRPLIKYKKFLPHRYLSRLPVIGSFTIQNKDGICYKIETDGFDPIANLVYWSNGNGYEPGIINLLHSIGRKGEIFFDIGANTGFISIQMALLPSAKKVYSFEPLPRAYDSLIRNLRINLLNKCEAFQLAVGRSDSISAFYVPKVFAIPTGSSLYPNKYKDTYPIEVTTVTLDHFIEEHHIKNIDIIKIDVEGKEADVLFGMKNVLEKMRPFIICEILPSIGDFSRIYAYLEPFEYHIYEILDDKILPINDPMKYKQNSCRDFLLSPKKFKNLSIN